MRKTQNPNLRAWPQGYRFTPFVATALATVVVLITWLLLSFNIAPAHATGGCGTAPNPIVCENALPGTDPSVWDINGAGDSDIQGFSTDISVNVGSPISFKIDTTAKAYTIQIFRTGYYQGLGARKIADVTPSATLPQVQPQCVSDATTQLYDCGNWAVSASWNVPSDAVSGVYLALLTRTDNGDQSHITFIVRNDASHSAILFQTSDPTWEAYNTYGGADFYQGAGVGRAYKVSYNRPMATRQNNSGRDFYFSNEYPTVRFLEKNGYDVSYFSGVDTDRYGSELLNHKVFMSVGHDEYWSAAQRNNVVAARDAGVNLQFLSGNEMYWHTRYEPSIAGTPTNYRTLVTYKETWSNAKIDPTPEWTGTWRDPRFASQANGAGLPENAVTGTMYMSNFSDLAITVTAAQGKTRMWRNTSLTSLAAGTTAALAPDTVGYESDEDLDNGFRPAGLIDLSTTVGPVPQYLQDFGNNTDPGTTTHHVTLYRAPSGALVFSAGTIQWAWGLDATHDGSGGAADARMQQAQVNLLADMGAQPATLVSGLVATPASTDHTPPVATITSPAPNASIANGASVTVTGTASDVGGVVAGVEVSTDGGTTWHPATGTTSWTYTYIQSGVGAQSIRVRATDDSGNYPSTPTTLAVNATSPYSIFGQTVPKTPDAGDTSGVELGLRFTPSQSGYITGVRFYKSAANTGTHTGSLWDANGTRLATVTFTGETASGWQTALFTSVVPVAAGVTYTVSYSAPNGHYAATQLYWSYRGVSSAPLTVAGGFGSTPPGVYNTSTGQYPTNSYAQSNYYVDALFTLTDNSPLQATGQFPLAGSSSVPTSTTIGAVFSKPVVPTSISVVVKNPSGATIPGTVSYAATTRTATFTPSSALNTSTVYSVTLGATDTSGFTLSSGQTWSFTTVQPNPAPGVCPCGLMTDSTVPTVLQVTDNPVSVGVTFSSSVNGTVSGIRFYKSAGNTGTHVGTLWSAAGGILASATFTNESSSGWQTVTFSSPVSVTAGTKYVAAYRTTTGFYSSIPGAFSGSGITNSPLTAGTGAGAFSYSDTFPSGSSTTNYMVDVVFNRVAATISVAGQSPASGATNVATSSPITMQLSSAIASGYAVSVTSGGSPVAGKTYLSSDATTITFLPTGGLPAGATVNVSVSGVISQLGATLPTQNWSFTTSATASPVTYTLFGLENPATAAANDSSSVELGTAFTTSQAGTVNAIRFYKGTTNTGTHVGSLWSSTGTRLATVTFTNETASGWQTATLATPVAITAGQTYVVSYLAPNGNYAASPTYFSAAKVSGPLTAGATGNGRYVYGAGGVMPTNTYNATNYFVDVVFSPSAIPPTPVTVTSTSPASGATAVSPTTAVTATLSADPAGSTPQLALNGPGGAIAGTSSYDAPSHVVTFTPTTPLPWSTVVSPLVTVAGSAVSGGSWSFTTADAPPTVNVTTIFPTNAVPDVPGWGDSNEIQVGVRFQASVAGTVTGIRFYKGVENTGVHQGYLWSATGQQLASVTFSNETASGWQTATFSQPVAIQPGVEYRASYHSNVGWYSVTSGGLANAVTNGPLSTLAPGGVYQYGATFPGNTTTTNFWIDVFFVPNS